MAERKESKKYTKNTNNKTQSKNTQKSRSQKQAAPKKSAPKKDVKNNTQNRKNNKKPIKIIPLGGLGEIGKNITLYEYDGDMFLVDCGMSFPDEDMPGIDIVIPDFTFVLENKDKIKGLVVTHGHEDHIGAIPYLLRNFNVPIYATRLTIGLIEGKLKEHKLLESANLNVVKAGSVVKLGKFTVEFIHVNHSIPDATAFAIKCAGGTVVHTGDFKIDTTPIDDKVIDIARFAELGKEGVLALLSDSTNAERSGFTASEKLVGGSFSNLFRQAEGKRIIVATFSSNIHRIQQIIDEAARCNRKVAVSGRSMLNVVSIQIVVETTGSQGEPLSALHRMAFSDHRQVEIAPDDMIIISATPIPGNEKLVTKVINELMKRGANVVYERMYDVHVSGHACAEELKLIMSIVKPKYFIPLHGEQKHLMKHAELAQLMGINKEKTVVAQNGSVIEISEKAVKSTDAVTAGRVLVDGLGVGDVGSIVLRDRKLLSDGGIIIVGVTIDAVTREIVAGPDIVSRGFIYMKESEELIQEISDLVWDIMDRCYYQNIRDWATIKNKIKDGVSKFLFTKTKRSPMVLPIIMEV